MKKFVLLAAVILLYSYAGAQSSSFADLSGKVIGENQTPISYATVTLLNAKDSMLAKGDLTDQKGSFSLQHIASGNYILNISYLGYEKYSKEVALSSDLDLGNIQLNKAAASLAGVTVQGVKPLIQHDNDKTILNVESSAFSSSGNAIDVLQRAPGVTVDNDGNIRLKGKTGVLVMIDGRETYLSPDQLANQLKNMSSENISKIEVITNPGAKYEASGSAGIINIVTKKNKREGLNGSANGTLSRGQDWSGKTGFDLNYRQGKVNYFGNYEYSNQNHVRTDEFERSFNYKGDESMVFEDDERNESFYDHEFKAGADYYLNDRNTIGFVANGFLFTENDHNITNSLVTDGEGNFNSSSITTGNLHDPYNNISLDLNYDGKLDTSGQEISGNADYAYYRGTGSDYYTTVFYNESGNETGIPYQIHNYDPTTVDIKSLKLDYSKPLGKQWQFGTGLKLSFVTTDNDLHATTQVNDEWMVDTTRSNHFRYTENINAGYINFSKQWKKLSIQAGLRGEQTVADGNSITLANQFSRNYFQLFPSFTVNDQLDKNNGLSLSYSRRIDRPQYQQLNPFVYYLDQYLYSVGNPNLKPQLTDAFSIGYSYKQSYTISFDYNITHDNIISLFYQNDSAKITYETPGNFDHVNYYDVSGYAPFQPWKWLSITPSFTVYFIDQKTQYLDSTFHASQLSWNANLQSSIQLPKDFSIDISAFYQSGGIWSLATFKPFGQFSVGAQKNLWKSKATVKVTVDDIFNTNHITGSINYANINGTIHQNNDTRQANLTFIYHFGNKANAPQRSHHGGDEEEKSRVKVGNN